MNDSRPAPRSAAAALHDRLTRAFAIAMIVIGVVLLVRAVGGEGVTGGLLGVLFLAAGCGRLYVQTRRRPRS
jgi:hypothetical protein